MHSSPSSQSSQFRHGGQRHGYRATAWCARESCSHAASAGWPQPRGRQGGNAELSRNVQHHGIECDNNSMQHESNAPIRCIPLHVAKARCSDMDASGTNGCHATAWYARESCSHAAPAGWRRPRGRHSGSAAVQERCNIAELSVTTTSCNCMCRSTSRLSSRAASRKQHRPRDVWLIPAQGEDRSPLLQRPRDPIRVHRPEQRAIEHGLTASTPEPERCACDGKGNVFAPGARRQLDGGHDVFPITVHAHRMRIAAAHRA